MTIQERPARLTIEDAAPEPRLHPAGHPANGKARSSSVGRFLETLLAAFSVAAGVVAFLVACLALNAELPVPGPTALLVAVGATLTLLVFLTIEVRRQGLASLDGASLIAILAGGTTLLALTALYQFSSYMRLPVDLLSYAESPFVNDILKFRLGLPIFTPPQDNNSYSYSPGTQILTYLLATLFGHGDSIPFLRAVQFSYVIAAVAVATSIFDMLARRFLSVPEYRHRPLWIAAAFSLLFLAATDSHVNLYITSLHNDGLAMLVNVSGFWLVTRFCMTPRAWLLVPMAVLPSIGFLVKQNGTIWAGLFPIVLLFAGKISFRRAGLLVVASALILAIVVGGCFALWGQLFRDWVFSSLANVQTSPLRSLQQLMIAGAYVVVGLIGGQVLVFRGLSRTGLALWLCWLLLLAAATYTSSVGWVPNHLGSAVVLGTCWGLVALIGAWPTLQRAVTRWRYVAEAAIGLASIFLFLGAMGLVREPASQVPPDMARYVADIEREFDGLSTDRVLMDTGTWIYLRNNVEMPDRSAPVSQLTAVNLPDFNPAYMKDTIQRIEQKRYEKILARQLDTGETWYDYHDRGTGIKAAMFANYEVMRRIPAVQGITQWWPLHLVSEILVLVPKTSGQ